MIFISILLKIYTGLTHCNDDENIDINRTKRLIYYRYESLNLNIVPEKINGKFTNRCGILIYSSKEITEEIFLKIKYRIDNLHYIYLVGFKDFLKLTDGKWYEKIDNISVDEILGIHVHLKIASDKKGVYFWFYYRYNFFIHHNRSIQENYKHSKLCNYK